MEKATLDVLWIVLCAGLVFNMQPGFLCLESGLTRSKNAINVAIKNVTDFAVSVVLYWLFGFGLMFGLSLNGWVGSSGFSATFTHSPWQTAFFFFQAMFCATSATIVSGAVAERMRFESYIAITCVIAGLIYPVFGHWAWGGVLEGTQGWLKTAGFVDFAGSTVVHSVGGWVAFAALLVIGPRRGRFPKKGTVQTIHGNSLPTAMLGVMLLFFGWFGFNAGSTLEFNAQATGILVNTMLAGSTGLLAALVASHLLKGRADVVYLINGTLAGLVAITAGCHAVSPTEAVFIGAVGAWVMVWTDQLLEKRRIDDAISAIPVHLGAGIWGTLAVAFFGEPLLLGTGLDMFEQLSVQFTGIAVCAVWAFGLAYVLFKTIDRLMPMRISAEAEQIGLNVSEHGARTDLLDLLQAMEKQQQNCDPAMRMPVEPFTEVGCIAAKYNQVMEALEKALNQTGAIIRDLRDGIFTFTRQGILTSFNPGAEKIFGLSAADALGRPVSGLLYEAPGNADKMEELMYFFQSGEKCECLGRRAGKQSFVMEISVSESRMAQDTLYTAMVRDISERKHMEEQIFAEKELAQVTLTSIGEGVITTDAQGRVCFMNPKAEKLTGWQQSEAEGLPLLQIFNVVNELDGLPMENPVDKVLRKGLAVGRSNHTVLLRRDGQEFPLQDNAAPIRNRDGYIIGAVLVFHDVTKTRKLARQLSWQASHDALTGLVNRREFEQRLNSLFSQTMQESNQNGLFLQTTAEKTLHVLCYIDLDQFKIVNDTCGHAAGDELLRQIAALFKSRVRGTDTLARLGGDEFGILFEQCSLDSALQVLNTIRELVHNFRFAWQGKSFGVGASIGLVEINCHSESVAQLLSRADAACYAAKEAGRNRVHIFQNDDIELLQRQGEMQWVTRLGKALDEDRLRLYFQPIVPLQTDEQHPPRCEILLRMLDRNGRIIPPGAFIPAAERYQLMPAIDRWVMQNTLAWLGDHFRKKAVIDKIYSINLSGTSLGDENFLETLLEQFRLSGAPPQAVCFEITETAAVANLSKAVHFLKTLKQLGCHFALDDFGSGLSSFGYLKNLPVDYLKIDGAFVKDIAQDPIDLAMVKSINSIGQVMGLQTIAEFVESHEVLQILRDIGVDYAQGFYVGSPQPLEEEMNIRMMPR